MNNCILPCAVGMGSTALTSLCSNSLLPVWGSIHGTWAILTGYGCMEMVKPCMAIILDHRSTAEGLFASAKPHPIWYFLAVLYDVELIDFSDVLGIDEYFSLSAVS